MLKSSIRQHKVSRRFYVVILFSLHEKVQRISARKSCRQEDSLQTFQLLLTSISSQIYVLSLLTRRQQTLHYLCRTQSDKYKTRLMRLNKVCIIWLTCRELMTTRLFYVCSTKKSAPSCLENLEFRSRTRLIIERVVRSEIVPLKLVSLVPKKITTRLS